VREETEADRHTERQKDREGREREKRESEKSEREKRERERERERERPDGSTEVAQGRGESLVMEFVLEFVGDFDQSSRRQTQ